jgi:hypothetical protein
MNVNPMKDRKEDSKNIEQLKNELNDLKSQLKKKNER